jgi:hypothetical protein
VALAALLAALGPGACASSGKAANKASEQRARELGLSSEALDPTVRERREGVGFWKSPEEPEGSVSPMSPDRRPWSGQP